MSATVSFRSGFAGRFLVLSILAATLVACSPSPPTEKPAADDSGKLSRAQAPMAVTPGDRSSSETDIVITTKIREAVAADESLSGYARNVKILTAGGIVFLRGAVGSVAEKASIAATAQGVSGVKRVQNDLEIATN